MADRADSELPASAADAPLQAQGYRGRDAARLVLRTAGYCVLCDRIVERCEDGTCPKGHPAAAVSGTIHLEAGEAVPSLPRFNWAAFALPPVWGPAHGQWVGALFLPIWLFADSAMSVAGRGTIELIGACVVATLTVAFQAFFAKRANGVAWRRVAHEVSVDEYVRRQRLWALACVPVGVAILAWGIYYRSTLI